VIYTNSATLEYGREQSATLPLHVATGADPEAPISEKILGKQQESKYLLKYMIARIYTWTCTLNLASP
jgi:hypothetical protein